MRLSSHTKKRTYWQSANKTAPPHRHFLPFISHSSFPLILLTARLIVFTIGRDYEMKDINYYTIDSGEREEYKNWLIEIAQNRLNAVPVFHNKGLDRIETFLGDKEDLVKEANDWVGNNNDHFKILDNEVHQHVIDLSTVSGKVQ